LSCFIILIFMRGCIFTGEIDWMYLWFIQDPLLNYGQQHTILTTAIFNISFFRKRTHTEVLSRHMVSLLYRHQCITEKTYAHGPDWIGAKMINKNLLAYRTESLKYTSKYQDLL
ncbi:hypothetical protein ACJX0J_005599, partial [Zea mays]